jgi:hypothetical protein
MASERTSPPIGPVTAQLKGRCAAASPSDSGPSAAAETV